MKDSLQFNDEFLGDSSIFQNIINFGKSISNTGLLYKCAEGFNISDSSGDYEVMDSRMDIFTNLSNFGSFDELLNENLKNYSGNKE